MCLAFTYGYGKRYDEQEDADSEVEATQDAEDVPLLG
jgi:hypothetical protein